MKRVRFLIRSYVDGVIYEAGDEATIDEQHVQAAHIVDLEGGEAPKVPAAGQDGGARFLDHTADEALRR